MPKATQGRGILSPVTTAPSGDNQTGRLKLWCCPRQSWLLQQPQAAWGATLPSSPGGGAAHSGSGRAESRCPRAHALCSPSVWPGADDLASLSLRFLQTAMPTTRGCSDHEMASHLGSSKRGLAHKRPPFDRRFQRLLKAPELLSIGKLKTLNPAQGSGEKQASHYHPTRQQDRPRPREGERLGGNHKASRRRGARRLPAWLPLLHHSQVVPRGAA